MICVRCPLDLIWMINNGYRFFLMVKWTCSLYGCCYMQGIFYFILINCFMLFFCCVFFLVFRGNYVTKCSTCNHGIYYGCWFLFCHFDRLLHFPGNTQRVGFIFHFILARKKCYTKQFSSDYTSSIFITN